MIAIIGAPFDLCGMRLGSRLGPAAIRLAGLEDALRSTGQQVVDRGDIATSLESENHGGLRNFRPLLGAIHALQSAVEAALADGATPLMIGGEHTLAVASISAALKHTRGDLAVLWIDAHADVNTPGISETGNIHGMPLAALCGEPSGAVSDDQRVEDEDWRELVAAHGSYALDPEAIAWYGLRDVDMAERPKLKGLPMTMHDIDRLGVPETVRKFDQWMRGTGKKNLWISFDVDSLDPILAPGTGTAVRGGLTYREAHLLAELLFEAMNEPDCPYRLAGADLVEVSPIHDTHNQTATVGVEWFASLFGKTILGYGVRA